MNVINVEELYKLKENDDIVVLDVREVDEITAQPYTQLKNLIEIPMQEVPNQLTKIDASKKIVVACRSGGRSATVCDFLSTQGYQTYNLTGGILAWEKYIQG